MARIRNDKLSGRLANAIFSSRYGKPYIKSRPSKVKNPKTPAQQKQRSKFRDANAFVSRNLHQLIRPYWNPEARCQQLSGQNLFCKINIHAFDENGNPDFDILKPVSGDLGGFENLNVDFLDNNIIEIRWTNNARDRKTNENNCLKIFGLDAQNYAHDLNCNSKRKDEFCKIQSEMNVFFLFFWNENLKIASEHRWVREKNSEGGNLSLIL